MNITTFKARMNMWAKARKLYENSSCVAQLLKAKEEDGELCRAYLKGDIPGMKDAIGDVTACLCNAHMMATVGSTVTYNVSGSDFKRLSGIFSTWMGQAICTKFNSAVIDGLIRLVEKQAGALGLDFQECLDVSWDAIKHRTGKMSANGAFVKNE